MRVAAFLLVTISDGPWRSVEGSADVVQAALDGDQGPLDLVEAADHRVVGIGSSALGHLGDAAGHISYDRGDRGELGFVWMHAGQYGR